MRPRPVRKLRGEAFDEVREASTILIGGRERLLTDGVRAVDLLRKHSAESIWSYWEWNRVRLLASHRAEGLGLTNPYWDERRGPLRALARETASQQELGALKAVRLLERSGIDVLCLKGPGLSKRLYGDAALRDPSSDIDLLVAANDLHHGTRVLGEQGWQLAEEPLTQGHFPDLHFAMAGAQGMPAVELHWRMQWYDFSRHTDHLLARREIIDGLPRPSTADLPHLLLLFWLRDGCHRLRLLADFAAAADLADELARPDVSSLRAPIDNVAEVASATLRSHASNASAAVKVASHVALNDHVATRRGEYSQVALMAALLAGHENRRHTALRLWLRDPAFLAGQHEDLGPLTLPLARAFSAARTTTDALGLLAQGTFRAHQATRSDSAAPRR